VDGCTDARMHDSGVIAYVTVERTCAPGAPFTVYFPTDTGIQSVAFTGLGVEQVVSFGSWERRVTVVQRGTWRRFPNTEAWNWRDGAGLLAKDGGLYFLSGGNGDDRNAPPDVWFTNDLVTWTRLVEQAPWMGRHGAGWVVHRGRLYIVSGDFATDAWSSADGTTWLQHTDTADFGPLYAPNAVSLNDELILYNGMRPDYSGETGVWASGDGTEWQRVATVPYQGRALIHGLAVFQGRVYVIGGGLKGETDDGDWPVDTTAEFSDIWSSADGRVWRKEADTLGFAPRTHFSVLGTAQGCYVANGSVGLQRLTTGEVYFASDCIHFKRVSDPSPMPGVHATSMAEFNGSIVITGGHGSVVGSAVWQYFPN
jgi:hypothetical protein